MVKIKTATKLTDIKGVEVKDTIGSFLSECLWMSRKNQSLGYVLAKKFAIENEVNLKAEDIVYIKEVLAEVGAIAGYAGQIIDLMESIEK